MDVVIVKMQFVVQKQIVAVQTHLYVARNWMVRKYLVAALSHIQFVVKMESIAVPQITSVCYKLEHVCPLRYVFTSYLD